MDALTEYAMKKLQNALKMAFLIQSVYANLMRIALIKDGLAQSSAMICRYTKTISMENASAKNALMPQNQFK